MKKIIINKKKAFFTCEKKIKQINDQNVNTVYRLYTSVVGKKTNQS